MQYEIEKSFERDVRKAKTPALAKAIIRALESVEKAETIQEIKGIKKMAGHPTAYRIRTGSYRIGVFVENNTVIFTAFSHRKNIYKKFP